MSNLYTFDIEVAPVQNIENYEKTPMNLVKKGDDVNVYSVATFDISKLEGSNRQNKIGFVQHNSFDSFFAYFKRMSNGRQSWRFYVHNLNYEASFLIPWLLRHGCSQTMDAPEKNEWRVIESPGTTYLLSVKLGNVSFTFEDTLCKTCVSLDELFKTVGYDAKVKGKKDKEYDYTRVREKAETAGDDADYIYDDVAGLATVWVKMLRNAKLTIAGDAFYHFVNDFYGDYSGRKTKDGEEIPYSWKLNDFKREFPGKIVNKTFEPFYIGGFCDLIDAESSKRYDFPIYSYDKNSMYPTVMLGNMPCGIPKREKWMGGAPEKYVDSKPYKIVFFHIKFRIKNVKTFNYYAGKYSRTLYDEHEEMMYLDCLKLFCSCYDFAEFKIIETFSFNIHENLFKKYINHYYAIKQESEDVARFMAKRFLNALYGKMAEKSFSIDKTYFLKNEILHSNQTQTEKPENEIKSYVPLALYIVQKARVNLLSMVNTVRNNDFQVFYCDTDSIKTNASPHEMEKIGMEIDRKKLGAWKLEGCGVKNVFVCPKKYMMVDEVGKIVCYGKSGINKVSSKDTIEKTVNINQITIDNYKIGLNITVNRKRSVKGGILLVPTQYTIRF